MYSDTETRTDDAGHKLFSYMIFLKHSYDDSLNKTILRRAENEDEVGDKMCIKFITDLTELRIYIAKNVNLYKEMIPEEKRLFKLNNTPEKCLFCNITVNKLNEIALKKIALIDNSNENKENMINDINEEKQTAVGVITNVIKQNKEF